MLSFISKHKFRCACLAAVVLLAGMIVFLVFYDAAPPNDRDLKPFTAIPESREDNAATILRQLPQRAMLDRNDFPELYYRISEDDWAVFARDGIGPAMVRTRVVNKNAGIIALLDEAAAKPALQFGAPYSGMLKFDPGARRVIESFKNSIPVARIVYRDEHGTFRTEALEDALKMLTLARSFTMATEQDYYALYAGVTAEGIMLEVIADAIASLNNRIACTQTVVRLAPAYEIPAVFRSLQQHYYTSFWASTKAEDDIWEEPLGGRYVFKRNLTKRMMCDLMREAIASSAARTTSIKGPYFREAMAHHEARQHPRYQAYWVPNAQGDAIVADYAPMLETAYAELLNKRAFTEVVRCGFALRAYWLDNKSLPKSLYALVPRYMPEIPTDAYGNKILQYSPEKCLVYSAGPKLIYDDGAFAFDKGAQPTGPRPFLILRWAMPD